ncbi:MAG: methylated-DNA--[protein]-cysteine S-methyltransferase [Nitratireductor sp.]
MEHESLNDYNLVCKVIELISQNWQDQPQLEALATEVNRSPTQLQKLFTRWAGLSPKDFLQAVTLDHAKRLLADDLPLLDASFELGYSSPARLHDLFVTHEAMSPGVYKSGGEGIEIFYGYHACQFGTALVMATNRGLASISFADNREETLPNATHPLKNKDEAFEDMASRWPKATFTLNQELTAPYAKRSFDKNSWQKDDPLRVVLIGTDFEIRVWEGLMNIPLGTATTYSELGSSIGVNAPRAIGRAVGRNPISFVVPCHRVVGKSGALTGYHWGLTRKRAMLGWETGVVAS